MSDLVQSVKKRLHAQGGRLTSQRRLILEALERRSCHPTAEELYAVVIEQHPRLNLSTVYRTLRWLEQEGLINRRRFDEEHRQQRFEPSIPSEHHHFICQQCKMVFEFEDPHVLAIIRRFSSRSHARVATASLVLYGLCEKCATSPSSSKTTEVG